MSTSSFSSRSVNTDIRAYDSVDPLRTNSYCPSERIDEREVVRARKKKEPRQDQKMKTVTFVISGFLSWRWLLYVPLEISLFSSFFFSFRYTLDWGKHRRREKERKQAQEENGKEKEENKR